MDLCYEKETKLLTKLMHGAERVEDKNNHIYHIPGCDAHGIIYIHNLELVLSDGGALSLYIYITTEKSSPEHVK